MSNDKSSLPAGRSLSVERYNVYRDGQMEEVQDGEWVRYDDVAALLRAAGNAGEVQPASGAPHGPFCDTDCACGQGNSPVSPSPGSGSPTEPTITFYQDRGAASAGTSPATPTLRKVMQRPNGCWAACISTLTGIPLDEFPAVPDDAREEAWWDEHGTRLRNEITAVLRKHGWRKESTWYDCPRGFAMAYGQSPRGFDHAVVVKDGELWHDPHPEGGGILDVQQYEILVPIIAGSLPRRHSNGDTK